MVERARQIKINVEQVLTQKCECPICFNVYQDPHLTKCGHTFCKECISEVINRQHLCPECRAPA